MNHLAQCTFMSPEISPYAPGDDDVVGVFGLRSCQNCCYAMGLSPLTTRERGTAGTRRHLDDGGRPMVVSGEWIGPHPLDLCDGSVGHRSRADCAFLVTSCSDSAHTRSRG